MRSLTVVALLALATSPFPTGSAVAGGPRAETSSVSSPLIACPAGDSVLRVTLRDALGNPSAGWDAIVGFESCPALQLPPVLGDEGYDVQFPYLIKSSDLDGHADFEIRAGGTCPATTVRVYGGGQLFAYRALASPDQDGNLGVGTEDYALAESKLGSADPTADFDGDGMVTSADLDILSGHLGHYAPGMATPLALRSWGTVKLLYR